DEQVGGARQLRPDRTGVQQQDRGTDEDGVLGDGHGAPPGVPAADLADHQWVAAGEGVAAAAQRLRSVLASCHAGHPDGGNLADSGMSRAASPSGGASAMVSSPTLRSNHSMLFTAQITAPASSAATATGTTALVRA